MLITTKTRYIAWSNCYIPNMVRSLAKDPSLTCILPRRLRRLIRALFFQIIRVFMNFNFAFPLCPDTTCAFGIIVSKTPIFQSGYGQCFEGIFAKTTLASEDKAKLSLHRRKKRICSQNLGILSFKQRVMNFYLPRLKVYSFSSSIYFSDINKVDDIICTMYDFRFSTDEIGADEFWTIYLGSPNFSNLTKPKIEPV